MDGGHLGAMTLRTMTFNLMAHNFTIKNRALSITTLDAECRVFIVMLSVNRLIEQCKDGCLRGAMTFRTITFNVMTLSIAIKTCHSALQC
jgi:hypothetical protein